MIPEAAAEARWHGTRGGYSNHSCRCVKCRRAHCEYTADAKARRTAAPKDPFDPRHGTPAFYGNHGCRCDKCRVAWNTAITEDSRNRRAAS